jgi:hypothetical protein
LTLSQNLLLEVAVVGAVLGAEGGILVLEVVAANPLPPRPPPKYNRDACREAAAFDKASC